jgi:predicted DNA-binding transcriptional regulator AlpA
MVIDAVTPTRRPATPHRAPVAERKVIDEISPQEAADILQMSRPSVMRLIQKGFLHPRKVLSRNKLSRAEVLAYQAEHAREQREALTNLTALSNEYDF